MIHYPNSRSSSACRLEYPGPRVTNTPRYLQRARDLQKRAGVQRTVVGVFPPACAPRYSRRGAAPDALSRQRRGGQGGAGGWSCDRGQLGQRVAVSCGLIVRLYCSHPPEECLRVRRRGRCGVALGTCGGLLRPEWGNVSFGCENGRGQRMGQRKLPAQETSLRQFVRVDEAVYRGERFGMAMQ